MVELQSNEQAGGYAPKSGAVAGLARAFFIRFYRFLGGYAPKKHWIFSRETGWSCSEFCKHISEMMINNVNGELVARRSEMRSCSMVLSGITPEYVQYLCTVSLEEI